MLRRAGSPLVMLLPLLTSPLAGQDGSHGPLIFEEGSPLYRFFLTPAIDGADPVAHGRWKVTSRWAYSSIFEYSESEEVEQLFDLERLTGSLTVRYGVTPRLEVGARVRFERTHGGFLDSFITGFHDAFGLPNADREKFPEDAFEVFLMQADGTLRMRVSRRSFDLDELRLFGKWLAYRSPDGRHAVSLRFATRIPGGQDAVPDQSVNFAGGALLRSSHSPWHLHGMLGLTSIRGRERLTELLHPLALYFLVGGERELGETWSILAQFLGSTPYVKSLGTRELDRPSVNLVMGFAGQLDSGWGWQFSFTEDVPPNSPAVDFTLSAVVSKAW